MMQHMSATSRKALATVLFLILVGVGVVLVVRAQTDSVPTDKVHVTASYYPLYDFARQVGGDKVAVQNMTPAGTEPHDYEPSARALANAQKSAVFIYNGAGLEPWADGFLTDFEGNVVRANSNVTLYKDEGHSHEDEPQEDESELAYDPHFWLDPVIAQQIVATIRDGLVAADPANKTYYQDRAKTYAAQLQALDSEFRTGLQQCQQDTIVTAHGAFAYLAERYRFAVESIAGLTPEAEPSPARMAELTDHVREHNVRYVFFESLVSPRLADTIATETGAQTLVLDPLEGLSDTAQQQGKDYLRVQRENLANLRIARACR